MSGTVSYSPVGPSISFVAAPPRSPHHRRKGATAPLPSHAFTDHTRKQLYVAPPLGLILISYG